MGSVAICIQHSPEISSLVIGGVNCILTVRTSILTYQEPCNIILLDSSPWGILGVFESLTGMMERIGGHLSYLSQYSNTTFQNSESIQEVGAVYGFHYLLLINKLVGICGTYTGV